MYDYTIELAGDTMLSCFFGRRLKEDKIEGDTAFIFLRKLLAGLTSQTVDLFYAMFGAKFLQLGIRQMDREMNRKVRIYNAWTRQLLN